MNEQRTNLSQTAVSLMERMRGFHSGLPQEERALLEQLLELARLAAAQGNDVQGFANVNAFGATQVSSDLQALLALKWFVNDTHPAEDGADTAGADAAE